MIRIEEVHTMKRIKSMRKEWICAVCKKPLPIGSSGGRCFTGREPHQLCTKCFDDIETAQIEDEVDRCWSMDYKY